MREQTLMRMAQIRSSLLECAPELRSFIEEAVARQHPDEYFRALEIEHMASVVLGEAPADYRMERWLEAERWLAALLARCGRQEEIEAAVVDVAGSGDLFIWELFVWCLIDRESAGGLDPWAAAERIVLERLGPEPERADRRGPATDLLAICRAKQGNRLRVEGDVIGGFELVRKAASLLRPGGNVYITARVSSFYASAAIAAGHFELAEKKARRMLKLFQWLDYTVGVGEALNILTHTNTLCGRTSRDMLSTFLDSCESSFRLPERIAVQTKINLAGTIIYFHKGEGAKAVLEDLEHLDLGIAEEAWRRHYIGAYLLLNGKPDQARSILESVSATFFELGQPNQAHFVLLFEALCLLEAGDASKAARKALVAAEFFSLSSFYRDSARQAAQDILVTAQRRTLDRQLVLNLIDAAMCPAKKSLGEAR